MSRNEDDGVARDAWLSEALRHAPDADAVPPTALSESILRQARAAASAPRVPQRRSASLGQNLLAAWSWAARPAVAAGFGGVILATVVGLMWWDRPLEDALPPREVAMAPTPAAPPEAPTVAATPPAAPAAAIEAPRQSAPSTDPPTSSRALRAARPAASPQRAAPTRSTDAEVPAGTAAQRAPMPPPVMAETLPPASPGLRSAGAAANSGIAAAERREGAHDRMDATAAAAKAAAPLNDAATRAARAPAALAQRRDAAPDAGPIGPLRASVAAFPERWRWKRGDSAPQPWNDSLDAWLARLDDATRRPPPEDRNRPPEPAARFEAAPDAAAPVQLWLDGRLHSTLRFDATGVTVEAAGDPPVRRRAGMSATDAAALRAALDQATR